ncbi:hypothetical protein [Streptomyces sp. NPDC019890]
MSERAAGEAVYAMNDVPGLTDGDPPPSRLQLLTFLRRVQEQRLIEQQQ